MLLYRQPFKTPEVKSFFQVFGPNLSNCHLWPWLYWYPEDFRSPPIVTPHQVSSCIIKNFQKYLAYSLSPGNSNGLSWARAAYSAASLFSKRCLALSHSPVNSCDPSWARTAYSAPSLFIYKGVWLICYPNCDDTTAWPASSCLLCELQTFFWAKAKLEV